MPYSPKYFKGWYERNRVRLSEKRKQEYKENPELRKKLIEGSMRSRERHRKTPPLGYDYPFERTAGTLGISLWLFREWRRRGYYPEPLQFGRSLLFTLHQVKLLEGLATFFENHGHRLTRETKRELDTVVGYIYTNW